jgi:C-22 sterol desaturase
MQIMLHLLAANYDWHHHITPTSEEIRVFATIFPMVSSLVDNQTKKYTC